MGTEWCACGEGSMSAPLSSPYRSSGAVVAAGADGMTRQVSRARLAATPEHLRHVNANELVLTTAATLLATGEGGEGLVARLDAAQIAGIAVRLDSSDGLPEDVLIAADRLSLPVITFPDSAALADVTAAVLDALLKAQGQRLERVLDIHQRFSRIVLAGGGVAEIAATLQDVTGCPVAVLDADGQVTVDHALGRRRRHSILRPAGGPPPDPRRGQRLRGDRRPDRSREARRRPAGGAGASGRWRSPCASPKRAQWRKRRSASPPSRSRSSSPATPGTPPKSPSGRSASAGTSERHEPSCWPRSTRLPDSITLPGALATIAAAARATLGRDAIVWTRSATIAALLAPDVRCAGRATAHRRGPPPRARRAAAVSHREHRSRQARRRSRAPVPQLPRGEPGRGRRAMGEGPPCHGGVRRARARTHPRLHTYR